jgi:hypothetical protein
MAGGEGAGGGVGGEDDGVVSDGGGRQSLTERLVAVPERCSCSRWAAPTSATALTGLSKGVLEQSN